MSLATALAALVLTAAPGAANAAPEPPIVTRAARTAVAVTVYNQDLALVKDTRTLELPAGESALRFEDVAARIDPRTVAVRSVGASGEVAVVEQNYVFDLISPEKLMEKYVGHEVELIETDARLRTNVTRATLLSTNGGYVYRIGDQVAIGHPGRVVLPKLPDQLYARPTLLWRLGTRAAGRRAVEVSYLTTGLSWEADYVLRADAEDRAGDLTAWVTLTNTSGARYDDATLKLVAGQIHRAEPPVALERQVRAMDAIAMAAPRFAEEGLFEYHLYSLDRPTTLAENETKQIELLAARGVALAKRYVVVGQPGWFRSPQGDLARDVPVGVFLEFRNDTAHHLGMPLPGGIVRLYKQDKGGAEQLVGEDRLKHTPKDERVSLRAGDAFDVVARRVQTAYQQLNVKPWDAEVAFAVTLRNHKSAPVTVTLREPVGGQWKVVESSLPPIRVDAGTLGFEATVPPGGETVVSYRVQVGYR